MSQYALMNSEKDTRMKNPDKEQKRWAMDLEKLHMSGKKVIHGQSDDRMKKKMMERRTMSWRQRCRRRR